MRQRKNKKSTVYINPEYAKGYEMLRNPFAIADKRDVEVAYDNIKALQLIENESARQRQLKELADEKRRKEAENLDKRLADTLKKEEYRPKPFGGEGYAQHQAEKKAEAPSVKPIENLKDPEPPEYLKMPEQPKSDIPTIQYLSNTLKRQPSFTPTGRTSVADIGAQKESNTFTIYNPNGKEKAILDLDVSETMLEGIETAYSVADQEDELQKAQDNLKDAINGEGDPTHGNAWGQMWTEVGKLFQNMSVSGNRPAITYDPSIGITQKDFQKNTWSRNAIGTGAIRKNEGEIKADVGEINKYKELMRRGIDLQKYTGNINRIVDLSDKLNQLTRMQRTKDVQDLIKQTSAEIKRLQIENENSAKLVRDASTYFGNTDDAAMYSGMGWAPQGKKDTKYNLEAIENIIAKNGYNLSPTLKANLQQYTKNIDAAVEQINQEFRAKRPELLNRMADNIRELKSWQASKYNPSEEFTKKVNAVTEFNFTDPNTYIYGMPGLIGSSMSFGGYQLASTAIGLAAMVGTGGAAGAAIGGAASLGLGITGGHYENDTEVGDNYQQLFIDRLTKAGEYEKWQKEGRKAIGKKDATDDELMYAMAAGIYEPKEKIKDIAEIATYGLNNLYKNDMQAVVGSEIFEAGLNFLGPIVKFAKASMVTPGAKAARFQRMYRFMHEHPTAGKAMMAGKNFAKDFMESEVGGAIASSVAFPLVIAGKAAQAGVKAVGRALPKGAVKGITKRLGFAADLIEQMPKEILGAKAVAKNVGEFASKVFGAGWSEAIEEGKQYLNGKKFADGSYSGESDTLLDSILNDIAGGSRAAYSFVGDMFGVTADEELIANMKGGFLGGFGHTATIQGFNAVTGIHQDLKANDFVVNNVLAHKLADRTTIANNSYLATQTSPQQYERIMNAFDAMENVASTAEERNGGTDGLNFTTEDVREQRKAYQEVFDMANSQNVQDGAKQLDIRPGTKKFGNYVGLVMWAKDLAKQGVEGLNEIEKKANGLVNGLITGNQEEDRNIQEILGNMSYGDLMKINEDLGLAETEVQSTGEGAVQGGLGAEMLNNMNNIRAAIPNFVSYIKEIASLDALFTLRDQLEMNAEPTSADKRRLRSVNRQIKKLQSLSRFSIIKNATTADDFKLIPNQKLHDVLRDLYRDSANFVTDIEEATAVQYMLLGGKVASIDMLMSPEMQEAYKNAQTDITDRKKSALDLIDRYVASVKSDEELRQKIHDTFESTVSEEEQDVEDMETEEAPVEEATPEPEAAPEPVQSPVEPETQPTGTTVQPDPENAPESPKTTPEQTVQEPEGEIRPVVEDTEDYDALVAQMESEYAPSTNTMFTTNDLDVDFGVAAEDWAKVDQQTLDAVVAFNLRYAGFVGKWNGKPLSRAQYNGVHGAAVKMQREFNLLKERVHRSIQEYDDKQNRIVPNHENPTADQIWENLHSRELFEQELRDKFEAAVTELQMRWNHFINARNGKNQELYSVALSNVYELLNAAEDNNVQLGYGSIENYLRVKGDIDEYNKLYMNNLEPPVVPPTIEIPSTRYERPWAQYTTTHTGMESSRGFNIEDSIAIDGSGIRLQDVSANPDFLDNGIFWFTTRLSTRTPKIQLNVIYNGHQFSPVDIHTSDSTNGKGRLFYSTVVRMLGDAAGRRVMPQKSAISRSNGIIEGDGLRTFEQMGLLRDDNLYEIEYSSSQDTFCIVQYKKDGTPVAYVPGLAGGHHEVYEYSKVRPQGTKPADGGMVMMVHPPYPEMDKDEKVPINVHYTPVTEGDAQLIIDLLSGKYMKDLGDYGAHAMENQVFFEDGIEKGLTRMQVLRMLIRYKSSEEKYNPYQQSLRYIEYDREDQRYVILHGNFGEGVEIPNGGRFNILDEQDQKTLKEFLMAHHNKTFTYDEFLECRVNKGNYNFQHPLNGLTAFKESEMGKEVFRNGGQLTFGNSTIIFDEKDFGDAAHPDGVSGLAWAMRRGFVQTKFTGFTNPLLNFNEDVPLVYNDSPQQQATQPQPKNPATELIDDIQTSEDLGIDDSLEDMDLMTGEKAKDKFSIEKANEFLSKVLGEEITDKNVTDKLAEIARTNASVLGLCHFSGKLLFDPYAPQGTMYHEAFHKVVELLLGDKTRKMLYKAYAKKMHIKYKDDADLLSNKQVREGLAEEFRYYMENRPTFNLGALRNPFKFLQQAVKVMGKIGDFRLYTFYTMTRLGVTKHLWSLNVEKVNRFLESHGAFAPFEIGGHEFKHILNRYQYRVLRNTLLYLVFRTNDVSITGEGLENLKISKAAIERDKNYQTMIKSKAHGALALQELVENIDAVENDLRTYLSNTFEINRNEDDEAENTQDIESGEGAMEASFNQLKYSHETSQFSRTGAKVKFMLARIPKKRFGYKAGKRVSKNILNDEGLVEYFDVKYVFNTLVNQCHDCRNSKELLNKLAKLGKDNAMFDYIHKNIVLELYDKAQQGDADAEAAFSQLLVALHAAKGEYIIGKATRAQDGTWSVSIQNTDSDYNAREYRTVWSQLFANGSEYLEKTTTGYDMKFRKGTDRRYSPEVFHHIYEFFNSIKKAVSSGGTVTVNFKGEDGKVRATELDVTKEDQFDYVKDEFCNTLQKLGIQFSKDELNYTLRLKYGSSDHTALMQMFESNGVDNITPFLDWIRGCYNPVTKSLNITPNGTLNGRPIDTAIGSFGFIGMLANAKYKYTHDHDQLSVLATKGNRYYVISENSLITDVTDDINASINGDKGPLNELKSFSYNYMEQGSRKLGSIVIKQVEDGNKLKVVTVAGFRTDQKGDMGQDYAEISPAEDYITKCQIIMQEGGLIFPTMSDKKTWTYLTGVTLPGLSHINAFTDLGNGKYSMSQDRQVLEQLLEYALCEKKAIEECIKSVRGYTDENGVRHQPLDESQKVMNYHKGEEYDGHTIIQGGRFGVLTGIYDEDGNWVSFNRLHEEGSKKYKDEVANWKTAQEYFFGVPDPEKPGMYYIKTKKGDSGWNSGKRVNEQELKEHQFKLLTRSLNKQVENELKYAEDLGLIEKVSNDEKIPVVLRYRNKLLDNQQIRMLKDSYRNIKDEQQRESMAITAFLSRVSAASNISIQEVERLYAGHPAFFKWHWNSKGELSDRSVDQHKRLGGLISTGQNNVLDIPGIPTKYVCAEVDNEMVSSALQDDLAKMIEDGELRSAYMRTQLDKAGITFANSNSEQAKEVAQRIESMSIEDIKAALKKDNEDIYKMLEKNATKKASDFMSDIDVADGAAYVTDEMAEWLLRMVGSWDSKVERAFKILRGEEVDGKVYTTKDILTLQQAYKDVLTTVIGNQKYTAYGFRFANGIASPYYDKMALFPMFKCISTGATAKVFDKMKKEGVHMLMINSAVKVGSQGSKPMAMSSFREDNDPSNDNNFISGDAANQDWKPSYDDFSFNKYEQAFKYIRKQFNTDPHGELTNKMGTQMTKVVMASLMPGRDYTILESVDENGNKTFRTASALDVRNDIMNCINQISNLGEQKVRDRFIKETKTTDENGEEVVTKEIKIEELSKFLKEELASRGASQEAIDAVSLTLDADGEPVMYIPPVAQNSLEWIQSIITSMINKNVIDINTPGAAFIQRSAWSMEGRTTVQDEEDLPPSIYEGRELQMINEEGSMDCVLSIDFFDDIIPEDIVRDDEGHIVYEMNDEGQYLYTTTTDENGSEIRKRIPKMRKKSFEDARQWLIENGIISGRKKNGEWSNATANVIGSRIPTQAQSSIHALRCVDVLPVVRDTIVLPKEFTKITGADFDIDKLFLSRFYYDVKGGKASTNFKEGSHEYYANRLLNDYIALLKDSKSEDEQNVNRTAHSNHASIDGDTKLLKDIIKDLEQGLPEEALDPYTPYSLWANASTKTEFITGKFGIGPFALNNNSHILTMLYGVKFKQDGFLGELGMYRLDQSSDRYGNSILSWISGLINAHVDVAKDPYIARLNVNSYTYNLVNLMIRTGFGKDTFYFTTQPIMKAMAVAYNNAASQYGSESSRSKSRRQTEAVESVVYNFIKSNFNLPSNVNSLKQANKVLDGYFEKVRGITVDEAVKILLSKDNDLLHQISKNHIPMNGHARMYTIKGDIKLSAAEIQYLVYRAKDNFSPYEQQLSDLVKYSKIDTRKQGKNVTEQMSYRDGVEKMFDNPAKDYGLFEDLSSYYEDSYIKDKTKNALDLFMDIMGSFTIESTAQFQVQVNNILHAIGEDNASADMRKTVSKQIMNYIRAGFFNTWAEKNNINIKGLVSGKNTISDRLEDIRIKIMTDPAYSDLRAVDGSIKNYLLASLVQGFQYKENLRETAYNAGTQPGTYLDVKFIKTLNFMDSDHVNEDDMAEAWDELLNDTLHPELRMFARDLIMYAYITSGGNSGNNLFKYIPNSWKLNSYDNNTTEDGYAQYMLNQLELYQNSTDELPINIEEIILNNWFDDKFIPTIKLDGVMFKATGYYTGRHYYEGRNAPEVSMPILLIKENADIEGFSDEEYIKIKRDCVDPHSPRNYTLYKKISYTTDGRLIYAMIDPKGNKFPHDVVYEMRRNDASIQESTAIAGISAQFSESIVVASSAMGIKGGSISDIISKFVGVLKATDNVGTGMAMINAFTEDPVLAKLLKDAAGIHLAEDGVAEAERPAQNRQEAEETGARTYEPSAENKQEPEKHFDVKTAEFYSGGAIGSDTEWGNVAQEYGIKVKHYSVDDFDKLPQEWKDKIEEEYLDVVSDLGRKELSADSYAGKLVRRDMMQADKADAVFAIVRTDKYDGSISGGTAYAIGRAEMRNIPIYFFDLNDNKWYQSFYETNDRGEVYLDGYGEYYGVPTLTPHAAVIGTRQINEDGKKAIRDIFDNTIKSRDVDLNADERAIRQKISEIFEAFDVNDLEQIGEGSKEYWSKFKHGDRTTAKAILQDIKIDAGTAESSKIIADTILKALSKLDVQVIFDENLPEDGLYTTEFKGEKGEFIIMKPGAWRSNSVFLHEASHAITAIAIDRHPELQEGLTKIRKHVAAYITDMVYKDGYSADLVELFGLTYGTFNDDASEFVAEVVSNPIYQDLLRRIPAVDNNKFKSAFDEFINFIKTAIARILGYNEAPKSLLDQLDPIIKNIINYQYANRDLLLKQSIAKGHRNDIYDASRRLKTRVAMVFTVNRASGDKSFGLSDINIGIQTESGENGKYVTVKPNDSKNVDKTKQLLDKLTEMFTDYSYIQKGNKFLVTSSEYVNTPNNGAKDSNMFNKYNLYKLDGPEAFSEIIRMQNDDPELFNEYMSELRKDLNC